MDTQEIACAVLGCPGTGEIRLIDLDTDAIPLPDAEAAKMHERGMYLVGTLGYANGIMAATCDDTKDLRDNALMLAACVEFSRHVANRLTPQDDGSGWVDWLKKIWSLPDTREN